ncbi:RAD52 family DNA repair protein [Patescibacteria group bacterium]|nr:RAD52 family DNA repair protein [Patescibacteria group bacterium]
MKAKQGFKLPRKLIVKRLKAYQRKPWAFSPGKLIKKRPGPGGKELEYVEIGYVVNLLNQAFGWDWDFIIIDQEVGKKQVWVRGELAVRIKDHTIIKAQYGGSDIKYTRNGELISIADDLKAAASDCLKKCASLLGIAGDVYWPELDRWNM